MTIRILSPELANQIAAGEVVERPSSVVKELVENSLDANAKKIDIEVHRGGIELIRIRDNGCGIHKEDLPLALARHATNKIDSLEDLQSILSMGFRGEALASISSVSRLQLTSRPAEQNEAWQAYAEGREMNVTIKPTSHPVGSTIEVLNLFYNTPARRKFLKTEKTEWQHIDEVVRRLALSRFDVAIDLSHNGKLVRQYTVATSELQKERRLLRLCGTSFLQHAFTLSLNHSGLSLKGWILNPHSPKINDIQYFYINRRIIRDRVVTHAIRQAYEATSTESRTPGYVLYMEIDPRQVDVNVHPAKQEVRFHQARLVHDFIYQAVTTALNHSKPLFSACSSDTPCSYDAPSSSGISPHSPMSEMPVLEKITEIPQQNRLAAGINQYAQPDRVFNEDPVLTGRACETPAPFYKASQKEHEKISLKKEISGEVNQHYFGRVLRIFSPCYALIEYRDNIALLSLPEAERLLKKVFLTPPSERLQIHPMLIPVKLKLKKPEIMAWERHQNLLTLMGVEMVIEKNTALLRGISLEWRSHNLQKFIPELLAYLSEHETMLPEDLADWLASQPHSLHREWTTSQAILLLTDFKRFCFESMKNPSATLLQLIDIKPALALLRDEKN